MAILKPERVQQYAALVAGVPGDFVEIGVFRGDSFQHLVRCAKRLERRAHAFDSFEGMASPSIHDGGYYPKGKLSVGGIHKFQEGMKERGIESKEYTCWAGFIPNCFEGFDKPIAFAFVDVDQYWPTKIALEWAWSRMKSGAVLVCDDFFRGRKILSSKAIEEFISGLNVLDAAVLECVDSQLVIQNRRDWIPLSSIAD